MKRVAFSATIRIGTEPDRLAQQNVERARKLLNAGDKRGALFEGEKALSLDPKNKRASELVATVFPVVKAEDDAVDSLLQMGKESEQKRWFINAASEYLQVLKLDPDNVRAKIAIKRIRNEVNVHAEKYFQVGVKYFNDGKIEFAKNIFSAIALVRPEHKGSQEYLKKIRGIYTKEAEEHYYTGLGYLSQRNYDKAEEEFRAALDIVPQYNDAQKYLDRIEKARKQNQSQIETLLADGERFERRGSLKSAQIRYQKALKIEPGDPLVTQKLNALNKRINAYIKNKYRYGEREYRNRNYKTAAKFFRAVLAIEPGHSGARRYLRLISKASHGKTNAYVDRAKQEIAAGNLEHAVAILDSALSVNPNLKEAKDLKNQTVTRLNSSQLIEKAKSQYLSGHYLDALEAFNQILKNDPTNQDAQDYRKLCQSKLNDRVDDFFNRGIRFYTEEKYQLAIVEWNKALKINPYHKGSLEYKKRAQNRLEALNRLK
ncbi:MAG: tetratricopeptide repeat protein [Actinobacteria bacterium]|nr:tetratricopeptide repeat protein [Actinomycetota bacterium]